MGPGSFGAVVVGGFVNGLGLVRAFAALGFRVAVVRTEPFDIAHRSRWVDSHDAALGLDERPDVLAEVLERRVGEWSGRLVVPTSDGALASLALHRDRLASLYRLSVPPPGSVPSLLDKDRMLAAARQVGLVLPRDHGRLADAARSPGAIPFPVVVKPLAGHVFAARFGTKLLVARHERELLDLARRLATRLLAPYRRPRELAVWSARDPAPFLCEWAATLRHLPVGVARGALPGRPRPGGALPAVPAAGLASSCSPRGSSRPQEEAAAPAFPAETTARNLPPA